jgi:hypothetical protein
MWPVLWLGLDFPFRRRWFRKQNPKEVAIDVGSVTAMSLEDICALRAGPDDFPLKRPTSEIMKIYIKLTDLGSFNALFKNENSLGKERPILPEVASNICIERQAFDDVGAASKSHDGCCYCLFEGMKFPAF